MKVRRAILLTASLACLFSLRSMAQDSASQPAGETFPISNAADYKPDLIPMAVLSSKEETEKVTKATKRKADFNRDIFYKNKLEFSFESGWHPVNIPWVYDFLVGDSYNMTPLKYTLVPVIASLRWHVTDIGGPWILRGNFDFTFSGSVTFIPRGPETRYLVFIFGIRRNFVHPNWKVVPYFDQRGGIGNIDAKEPLGVQFAQGQNLTFTYNMGAGVRYNLDSRYSISAGMNYMHISNGYFSEPRFTNYGINVYGPMFGIDVRLGKPHHEASR
jgi:Lipid A 3-O-deacylase (PagL)